MKQKPLLKPPSHRFWLDYNLSKHLPIEFATFFAMGRCFDELKMQGNPGKRPLKGHDFQSAADTAHSFTVCSLPQAETTKVNLSVKHSQPSNL